MTSVPQTRHLAWLRVPGNLWLVAALVAVGVLYAPVISYDLVAYDDTWLVRDNFLLASPSWSTLTAVFTDLSGPTRFVLGAEYLPVRDLSVMLDLAVWGDWYGGHHLTSLVVYLLAIVAWFRALVALGIDRPLAGLAVLLWAILPSHAESVAWVSERKGLLGVAFAGLAALAYARFRAGATARWLAVAALAAVCGVWSKAPSAFALAVLAPLELFLPGRVSARRSLVGLAVVGGAGLVAFVPVVLVARELAVVTSGATPTPAGAIEMTLGLHGFYLQLAVMAVRNAVSYPISSAGPTLLDILVGAVSLVGALAVALVPARGWWRPPLAIRAGCLVWLIGFLPASRLVLPLRMVLVQDRYILFATLGVALVAAAALRAIPSRRARHALLATLLMAAAIRTLDARSTWRDTTTLWERAVTSNPADGAAWAGWVEALHAKGDHGKAFEVLRDGLRRTRSPRLALRKALMALEFGKRPVALKLMREAAELGEPKALSNYALMLLQDGKLDESLEWARKVARSAPMYAHGQRTLGEVALAAKQPAEALAALERALALAPSDMATRYLLGRALIDLGRPEDARTHLEACRGAPALASKCDAALGQLER